MVPEQVVAGGLDDRGATAGADLEVVQVGVVVDQDRGDRLGLGRAGLTLVARTFSPGRRDEEDMTSGQISYDLRRLRARQIIQRIPHSRAYQVTDGGLTIALFLIRVAQRLLILGLAQLTSPGPRPQPAPASRSRLPRRPDRPLPAGIPRRLLLPAAIARSNHEPACACHQPSHTPQLDSKFKIPAGKDNLPGCSGPVFAVRASL
jgi:hypothetical protein